MIREAFDNFFGKGETMIYIDIIKILLVGIIVIAYIAHNLQMKAISKLEKESKIITNDTNKISKSKKCGKFTENEQNETKN